MEGNAEAGVISNTGNRRVVEARKLRQRKYRESQKRFLVEGLQLLHMALDANVPVSEVFYDEEHCTGKEARSLIERFRKAGAAMLPVSRRVMESLSERDEPQGIAAVFFRSSRAA